MAKAKISSKDFLDILDSQNDLPAPALGSFGRSPPSPPVSLSNSDLQSAPLKQVANGYQTGSKEVAKRVAGVSSSSSSYVFDDFKTTTTSEPELLKTDAVQLSPEWQSIDYSLLSEIGFTEAHLVQVVRQGKLSAQEVQDSILFFAFDLNRNRKGASIHGSPLNFFMGILRRGQAYAPPENYESPESEARRKYLDGKRRMEEQKLAEEKELRDLEFTEWRRGLTADQMSGMVPEAIRDIRPAREASIKIYFENEVWPERSSKIPGMEIERAEIQREIEQSLTAERMK